jgi:hypothetical protein
LQTSISDKLSTGNNFDTPKNKSTGNIDTPKDNTSFSKILDNEKEKTVEEEKAITKSLFEDIISLLKTGLTVEELKALEKLIEELTKKIKEQASKGTQASLDEINKLMTDIENVIASFKKRITGEAIKEVEESSEFKAFTNKEDIDLSSIIQRLDEIKVDIKDLIQGNEQKGLNSSISNEELALINRLKLHESKN